MHDIKHASAFMYVHTFCFI